jgi:hypothetical protein
VCCASPWRLISFLVFGRSCRTLAYVAALLRFKIVRPSRLHDLIQTVEDAALRERLTEALALCRRC